MPIEVLGNQLQPNSSILSEIISQNQKFILGAKLESADFQFIAVDDAASFAALPEGAFFTDLDPNGLNRVGRKISGQRKYLGYEQELKAYVVDEIAKLKPIAVNPSVNPVLPTSTADRPIYAGQEIVFLTAGTVEGRQVEAGGIAIALADIPVGTKIDWNQLQYNGTGVAVTPILLRDSIRLDGTAAGDGATEKAIADAIIAVRNFLSNAITVLDSRVTTELTNLLNRVITVENRVTVLEGKPELKEEFVVFGNNQDQTFLIQLQNKYQTSAQLIWYMLFANGYVRINEQDGDVVEINGQSFFKAAFAGIPASNQFKVSVQGLVAPA